MTTSQIQAEALDRARQGQALTNYPAIYQGFMAKGITEADILPRENVFTFHAWKALGRSVKRGEHGVKVVTFIERTRELADGTTETFRAPWTSTVFHISQTEPTADREAHVSAHKPRRSFRTPQIAPLAGMAPLGASREQDQSWRNDPGELAADRWNETHGDR